MRRFLVLLFALGLSAPAQARPLARADGVVALAGEHVLVAPARAHTLTVTAFPLAGGPGRTVLRFRAPKGEAASVALSASAERAAALVQILHGSDVRDVQTFSGPPTGPWARFGSRPLAPPLPARLQVDGPRLFSTFFWDFDELAITVDGQPVAFDTPRDPRTAVFAGDVVAYSTRIPGEVTERDLRMVVRDWRTGAVRSVTDFPDSVQAIALRPDGRAAVEITGWPDVYDAPPGARPRRIGHRAWGPRFAGDRIVFAEEGGLRVAAPDGRVRRFGPPTRALAGFATDEHRVAWTANGCLLVAEATDTSTAAPGAGPCPRSEIDLVNAPRSPRLARTLPLGVQCVSAPTRCRGTISFAGGRERRFDVPSGRVRRVRLALPGRTYRRLSRLRHRQVPVAVVGRTDDGDRLRAHSELWVAVPD